MSPKTTEEAFEDRKKLRNSINHAKSLVKDFITEVEQIEDLTKEILDDPVRKAELKKISDISTVYTIAWFQTEIANLKTLKEKLI